MSNDRPITPTQQRQILDIGEQLRTASEEALEAVAGLRRRLEDEEGDHDDAMLNAYEFVLLLQHDLSLLLSGLLQETSRLGTSMYARLLILALYESSLQMRKLLATDFREQAGRALNLEDDRELKALHKSASEIFEACRRDFGMVRNGLAGHWTHDPEERQELIDRAEVRSVADLVIEMLNLIQRLTGLLAAYFYTWMHGSKPRSA